MEGRRVERAGAAALAKEIEADEFQKLLTHRRQIIKQFKALGYTYVSLDLAGFRSGSMNEPLTNYGH